MTFFLSLLLSSAFYAEIILTFQFSVLDHSTIIVEGEIVDADGRLKIKEFYRGHLDSGYITVEGLNSPSKLLEQGFVPGNNLVHQTCILFLKEAHGQLIPASSINHKSVALSMSIVWIINDSIFYGSQPVNPGALSFPPIRIKNISRIIYTCTTDPSILYLPHPI